MTQCKYFSNNWNQKPRGGKSSFRRSAPSGNPAVPRRQPGGSVTNQWGQPRRLSHRGSPPKTPNQKRTSPKGPKRRSTLNTTWQNNSQTSFGSNSPKTKNQKKNHHQKKKVNNSLAQTPNFNLNLFHSQPKSAICLLKKISKI